MTSTWRSWNSPSIVEFGVLFGHGGGSFWLDRASNSTAAHSFISYENRIATNGDEKNHGDIER